VNGFAKFLSKKNAVLWVTLAGIAFLFTGTWRFFWLRFGALASMVLASCF